MGDDVWRAPACPAGDGRRAADPRLPGRRRHARDDGAMAPGQRLAHSAPASARTSRARRTCARLEERLERLAEDRRSASRSSARAAAACSPRRSPRAGPSSCAGSSGWAPRASRARRPPVVLRPGRLRRRARHGPPGLSVGELPARRLLRPFRGDVAATSRPRSATSRSTRAPTGSSTGAPASTPPRRPRRDPRPHCGMSPNPTRTARGGGVARGSPTGRAARAHVRR